MAEIIAFPTKAIRDWTEIARALIDPLVAAGASETVQQRLSENMKSFREKLAIEFRITIPEVSPKVASQIKASIEENLRPFVEKLFLERLRCEITHCRELGLL